MRGVLENVITLPVFIIFIGAVEVVVQTPAFFSRQGSLNDQLRRDGDVSQLQSVLGNFKVPVIFLNLFQ